ncbi:hypothetical protein [Mariprofundus ferrooxydans]|uniref:Uncharacterized protein n=1 Tax=Mariprofundus ferrooxydans PV-1 TaxID=314345 RepID=Q0F1R6_9PROT|nr:hypothetical protein [Mariprofundus ferrooxydans]EAU55834.1 hypothetical protein SPV1_02762 [Mariprofundus ferrooxydans PV-1]KON47021.1 hypothetical protein AL013_10550 [Mariprofundus ferrooxydans]
MLRVKAKKGIRAPLLHRPKHYIDDTRIIEVEDCHYYRAMINDGDLVIATDAEWKAQLAADKKAAQNIEK